MTKKKMQSVPKIDRKGRKKEVPESLESGDQQLTNQEEVAEETLKDTKATTTEEGDNVGPQNESPPEPVDTLNVQASQVGLEENPNDETSQAADESSKEAEKEDSSGSGCSTSGSGSDFHIENGAKPPSKLEGGEEDSLLDEFYKPVKIPPVLYFCVMVMLGYEEGRQIAHDWTYGVEPYSLMTSKIMIFCFALWVTGFVLTCLNFVKYIAMFLNECIFRKLHRTAIPGRTKIIFAMIATKLGTTIWREQSTLLICDGGNAEYPRCEEHRAFKISMILSNAICCESNSNVALCKEILLHAPMIFLAISACVLGKCFLPSMMRRFPRPLPILKEECETRTDVKEKKTN